MSWDSAPAGVRVADGGLAETAMRILVDLWRFAMVRKKFWLIPVMILAVVYGALAVFTKGSVLAPFIYTIF
jgi:Family of unknown function (DUF5989)